MKEVHLSFHTNEDNPNPLQSITITDPNKGAWVLENGFPIGLGVGI